MRDLLRLRTLRVAAPAGLLIALACMPFIVAASPPGSLRTVQVLSLGPISVVLMQISLAWTPHRRAHEVVATVDSLGSALRLVLVGVVMSVSAFVFLDPLLLRALPGYLPRSLGMLFLSLPWVGLFQPLFLVAAAYAFGYRLTRRPLFAVTMVILTHQGILLLQQHSLSGNTLPFLLAISGIYGLVLGWSYRAHGLCGPAVIALLSQIRYLVHLL